MADEMAESCGICYEDRENLRILPCWHVACLTCILSMAQTGQGRAVRCHECREPFLFESIRSLPRPVRCQICKRFVKSPRKFPCCSRLYCTDCIPRPLSSCPNLCNYNLYNIQDLPLAKICRTCFCMHTEEPGACGHSFCTRCYGEQTTQRRECPLCSAIRNPLPYPIDPIQPSLDQLAVGLQDLNQQPGQQFDQMQFLSALQTIRMWQQRNAGQQQQQAARNPYTTEQAEKDIPKGIVFLLILVVAGYFWGLSYWLWIVCGLSLVLMRPNSFFLWMLFFCLNFILFLGSFYYYFRYASAMFIIDFAGVTVLKYFAGRFIRAEITANAVATCLGCVMLIVGLVYFPWIFIHRMAMSCLVQDFTKRCNIAQ